MFETQGGTRNRTQDLPKKGPAFITSSDHWTESVLAESGCLPHEQVCSREGSTIRVGGLRCVLHCSGFEAVISSSVFILPKFIILNIIGRLDCGPSSGSSAARMPRCSAAGHHPWLQHMCTAVEGFTLNP